MNRTATTQRFHVNGWGDLSIGGSVQLASITLVAALRIFGAQTVENARPEHGAERCPAADVHDPGPFPITVPDLPMNDVIARFSG